MGFDLCDERGIWGALKANLFGNNKEEIREERRR